MAKARRIAKQGYERRGHRQKEGGTRNQRSQVRALVVLAAVVSVVVMITHWPALSASAISFDDREYLLENPLVQNPSLDSAGRFLGEVLKPSTVGGYYQPLTMISLMLDYAVGGRTNDLRPFHRTSLLLHILNTALVIVLVYLLFGQAWPAAMIGLLFGVHPLTAESIPWVAERKTVLASFFALWCLVLYVGYTRKGGRKLYAAALLVFVLALMAKPTTTPLPLLLLLLDFWPLRRLRKRVIVEKIPFLILAGIAGLITVTSQAATSVVAMPGERSLPDILLVVCHNVVFYLSKFFWPANLSSHYPYPQPLALSHPAVLAGVVGTCILLAVLLIALRWTRAPLAGWLFFLLAVFPTLGIISFTDTIAAMRFVYFPAVGLLLVCASALCWWWTRLGRSSASAGRRLAPILVVVTVAAAEAVDTRSYLRHWRDTELLYEHMMSIAPEAPTLHYNLGVIRLKQNRPREALGHLNKVIETQPHFAQAYSDLGIALHSLGKPVEAITRFREALRIKPDFTWAHYNLGFALAGQRRFEEAENAYHDAVRTNPNFAPAYAALGRLRFTQGRLDQAVKYFGHALELQPGSASAHYDLGVALSRQGQVKRAVACFAQAIQISPGYVDARFALGHALELQGNLDEAIAEYQRILQMYPSYEPARSALGAAMAKKRRPGNP